MPDWSYHPIFRPLLFQMPPAAARDRTFGALGALARLPLGPEFIDLLGHMRPPDGLQRTQLGLTFPGPVGLAAGLDIHAAALPALARFGFGFLEAGPVTLAPLHGAAPERRDDRQALRYADLPANDGVDALAARLARHGRLPIPLGIRLSHDPAAHVAAATAECCQLAARLGPLADFFTLDTRAGIAQGWANADWAAHLGALATAGKPLLLCLAADLGPATLERIMAIGVPLGVAGVIVTDELADGPGFRACGPAALAPSLASVHAIRQRWGGLPVIAEGGVHCPEDALRLLGAGATFVQLHSGLVFAGPGLPKRINEAVAAAQPAPAVPPRSGLPAGWARRALANAAHPLAALRACPGWVWIALLGAGMVFSGTLAWLVAITRVVLPYDEAFVGLDRAELAFANARLLPFMAHDRVTLAGTMISIGVLYAQLALHGMRQGAHWARQAVLISASVGFASFFLFLGFGYFDPLHAVAALLLLPLFVLGMRAPLGPAEAPATPNLRNDQAWLLGLWGQLIFVGIGFGLMLAGAAIAAIGVSSVFVPEDLAFMRTTPAALQLVTPRLVALVAHDRAGFGGALVSDGLALTLAALWGFRQGARWLWWALAAAGAPGFVAAIGIHLVVGYTNLWHLSPALAAVVFFFIGLALARPHLCYAGRELRQARLEPEVLTETS